MYNNMKSKWGAALLAIAIATSPALAENNIETSTEQSQASFEQDRADILAMAGDYKVTFDMKETTSWRDDYTPIKAKISGGHESVRIISDTGNEIKLQHLLVAEFNGRSVIIKHWRQDWKYRPTNILAHTGTGTWQLQNVSNEMRKGAWSQTVYQVDDSPRYAGVGKWTTLNGVRSWRSNMTSPPLARRDATRNPVYDHYQAINRHQPTPNGWIHWQDNTKLKMVDGKAVPYVQESVLNSYEKFDGYKIEAADNYWKATQGYWSVVRDEWDNVITKTGGVTIEEEPNTGTIISGELLEMGNKIQKGEMTEAQAIAKAKNLIRGAASKPIKTAINTTTKASGN